MSMPARALVERYAAARAVERTAEDLRKQIQRALAGLIRPYMDARYEREHGRAPDPLTWRTDRVEVDSERGCLSVTGQYLYGDEWEPRVRTVEISIQELILAEAGVRGAEQGSEPRVEAREPDRDADVLNLLRGELLAMQGRVRVPEVRERIGPALEEDSSAPMLGPGLSCRQRLEEIRSVLYSLGSLSPDRFWVSLPIWAMREVSRLFRLPDEPEK